MQKIALLHPIQKEISRMIRLIPPVPNHFPVQTEILMQMSENEFVEEFREIEMM